MFRLSALAETVLITENEDSQYFPVNSQHVSIKISVILIEYFIFKIAVVSCLLEFHKKKCSMNFVLELGKNSHDL